MKRKLFSPVLILLLTITLITGSYGQKNRAYSKNYDIIIKNAIIYDGSGSRAFKSDVAIKDELIVKIANPIKGTAQRTINAKGLYISPGFIDLHTHAERNMYFPEQRPALNYLKQGVTTLIVGQCGQSAWNIFEKAEDQIRRWSQEGIGPNAALLAGHGTIRNIVLGTENRPPTAQELEKMKALVKEAMEQGASGLSTGLIYLPGRYAKTDEVIELVKVIAPYGGIYHTHIRNERNLLLTAIKEAMQISRQTGVPAHISHFKVMGKNNWGLVKKACTLIEKARAEGLKITADQYPYRFANGNPYRSMIPSSTWYSQGDNERLSSNDIKTIFSHLRDHELIELYKKVTPYFPLNEHHKQFLEDLSRDRLVQYVGQNLINPGYFRGPENPRERMLFLKRMTDPEEGEKIRRQVHAYIENLVGFENFVVGICTEKTYEGKSIKEVAALMGKAPADAAIKLELMGAKCIPLQMCEDDIEYIMQKDYVGTGSDGTTPYFGIGLTHIRSYSTFLNKINKYALQRKIVSVSHVIRSQTSLPAKIMNFKDRGWIKAGYKADIVVFDLNDLKIKTSISNPHQYSEGVRYLIINGKLVLDKGKFTGKLPGKVLTLHKN